METWRSEKTIKVQLPGQLTASAFIEGGIKSEDMAITFHAHTDRMKARVLELIASGRTVIVSLTNDAPMVGEWMESYKNKGE